MKSDQEVRSECVGHRKYRNTERYTETPGVPASALDKYTRSYDPEVLTLSCPDSLELNSGDSYLSLVLTRGARMVRHC